MRRYFPRLREHRISHGRKIEVRPPLFLGYAFVAIELQWHAARWTAGVLGLIMDGIGPARVPDNVIAAVPALSNSWSTSRWRCAKSVRLLSRRARSYRP